MNISDSEIAENIARYAHFSRGPKDCYMAKNDGKSQMARNEGNEFFKQSKFYDALMKYNQSLCFAKPGTIEMGMAYANRSAVYFECKLYEICLENIELASNCDYPKDKLPNLTARKEKCLKFLSGEVADDHLLKKTFTVEDSVNKKFDLKLSYEAHPQFPFMISSLQMNEDTESGRKFVSSDIDLKPGDIIAIEDGFLKTPSNVPLNFLPYQHCRECFSENLLNLRPCEFCVLSMYCSEKCRQSMQEFHQHRCDLFTNLIGYVSSAYAACKLFSYALAHFATIEDLKTFVESTDGTTSTMFDFDFSEPAKDRENYLKLIINSMPQGWNEWKIPDGQMKIVNHYMKIFFAETELKKLWAKHKTFIAAFIVRAFKIDMTQELTLSGYVMDEEKNAEGIERVKYGITGSAFSGLFHAMNHSCSTNTDRLPMNGKIYIIMMRPVKAGQELTAMKHYPYGTFDKKTRIEKMNKKLDRFQCKCDACRLNYPVHEKLSMSPNSIGRFFFETQTHQAYEAMAGFPVSFMNYYQTFCKYYTMDMKYPTYETASFETIIIIYFIIIGKFKTVWPLLRRECYLEMGRFMPFVFDGNILGSKNSPYFTTSTFRNPNIK